VAAKYKQRCIRCRKNYVTVSWRQRYAVCYDCQKKELERDISDPEMKKLFDIPEEFYKESSFLRDIKRSYLRYGRLTEKQKEAFRKTVEKLKDVKGKEAGEGKESYTKKT
jgi:hypothetical protein